MNTTGVVDLDRGMVLDTDVTVGMVVGASSSMISTKMEYTLKTGTATIEVMDATPGGGGAEETLIKVKETQTLNQGIMDGGMAYLMKKIGLLITMTFLLPGSDTKIGILTCGDEISRLPIGCMEKIKSITGSSKKNGSDGIKENRKIGGISLSQQISNLKLRTWSIRKFRKFQTNFLKRKRLYTIK
jgi:hypothetical protein